MAAVRVLLVEDSPSDAALFRAQLEEGAGADFEVEWVPTFAEGRERLHDADCTVLDLTLPDAQGLDSVKGLTEAAPDMPVIVVTGYDDEAGGVEAVRLGAQDYLLKDDIQRSELGRAVRHAIERKTAQTELEALTVELEERTRRLASSNHTIFDESASGMIQVGADGRVTHANPAMAALMGVDEEQLAGRPIGEIFGPRDGPAIAEAVRDVMDVGRPHHRDAVVLRADGTTRLTSVQMSNLTMDESGSTVVLLSVNDITAGSSARLRQANDQKLAELGRLAGGLAHEIRSPLQYVTTSMDFARATVTDLLAGSELSDEGRADLEESLKEVADGIARISEIVRGMNALAHRGSAEMALHDINEALDFPLAVARGQAPADTRFEVIRGDNPLVRFGLGPMQQVVLNLLVNAVQAVEDAQHPGVIEVRSDHDDDWVTLKITDNGIGMDRATLARSMEPFFTTKAEGRGTGQGLALVRDLMHQHGGTVTMESAAGAGTTVTVWLPRSSREEKDSSPIGPGR